MATKPNKVANPFEGVIVQVVAESAKTAQFALPVDQLSIIDNAIDKFFKYDKLVGEAERLTETAKGILNGCAKDIAVVLGTNPTYDHWMGVRGVTIGRMLSAKSISEDTAQSYWEKVICKELDSAFHLIKPKSVNPEAEKKRLQREAKAKKLQGFTDSELLDKAKECAMALDFDKGKEFTAELDRRAKESNTGLVNQCKEVRGEIILRLKGCLNLELLEEIRDMLPPVVIKAE